MKGAIYNAAFTLVLCCISAATVTAAKLQWQELQEAHKAGAKTGAIVEAFGLMDGAEDDPATAALLFRECVTAKTKKGAVTYTARKDGDLVGYAIEAHGTGLEGPIEAILAVGPDKRTVLGFRIHHQDETPGLGARISEREFLDQFVGKRITDANDEPGIRVVKGAKADNEVDAITGATLSSGAVERMLKVRLTEFVSGVTLQQLALELPDVVFAGVVSIPPGSTAEPPAAERRKSMSVPEGATNLASGKTITASDDEPLIGELDMLVDGEKKGGEEFCVQWFGGEHFQVDLGATYAVHAIAVWRDHHSGSIHQDVLVMLSDDAEFENSVTTVFNNDADNSAELGEGADKEYVETFEGKLIKVKGVKARYVRVYSGGNYEDDMSTFAELEVYGIPADAPEESDEGEE